MIRAVVFDLDHTLYDRYGTICEMVCHVREWFNVRPGVNDSEIAMRWIESDKKYAHHSLHKLYGDWINSDMFCDPLPTPERLIDFHYFVYSSCAVPFPYSISVLEELRRRGYKLGLITNGRGPVQRKKLELLGFENIFDHVLVGGEFGLQKPHTEMFDEMSRVLGIPPAEMMYVGDNPYNDVRASKKAGYVPVWLRLTEWPIADMQAPKHRIDAVYELLEFEELQGV